MHGEVSGLLLGLIVVLMMMALGIAIIYGTRQSGRKGRLRGPTSEGSMTGAGRSRSRGKGL